MSVMRGLFYLRALRPFKLISYSHNLKKQLTILLNSMIGLLHASIFMFAFIVFFAVLGLQAFIGDYYARCRVSPSPTNATYWEPFPNVERPCNIRYGTF